ncbi:hypothetical protein KFZ76_12070 [Methylovulum psychrotolerans]|uniref:hypothetical protein n=1 Tax=Methylovulum psychrotolerans TaxID=1704499 RepID=UPI001BFF987A|nr:hypothetical protein [Methylovulum psychrotolerans]MBT9098439.1 hypothetical protein [Methylovulum psychrotolerans]
MQMYLDMIQTYLGGTAGLGAAGIAIAVLLCLSVRARYRAILLKRDQELAQVQAAYSELDGAMTQAKQQTVEVLASLNTALAIEPEAGEETSIWQQQNGAVAKAISRLVEQDGSLEQSAQALVEQQELAASVLAKLQGKISQQKAYIAGLEMARLRVFDDLNQSGQHVRQLNAALERQAKAAKPDEKLVRQNQAYKTALENLRLSRLTVFDDLNASRHKLRQTEALLAAKVAASSAEVLELQTQIADYQAYIAKLEVDYLKVSDALGMAVRPSHQIADTLTELVEEGQAATPVEANPASEPPVPTPELTAASELAQVELVVVAEPVFEPPVVQAEEAVAEPVIAEAAQAELVEASPPAQPLFAKLLNSVKNDLHLGKKPSLPSEPAPEATVAAVQEEEPLVIAEAEPPAAPHKPEWFNFFKKASQSLPPASEPEQAVIEPEPEPEQAIAVEPEPAAIPNKPEWFSFLKKAPPTAPSEPEPIVETEPEIAEAASNKPAWLGFLKKAAQATPPEPEPIAEIIPEPTEAVSKPWFNVFKKAPFLPPEPEPALEVAAEPAADGGLTKQLPEQLKGWYKKITTLGQQSS